MAILGTVGGLGSRTSRWQSSPIRVSRDLLCVVMAIALQAMIVFSAGAQDAVEVVSPPTVIAQFTTAVENREPIDQITFVQNKVEKVFFFSDLRGLAGQTVQHRWIYDGKTVAEVSFEVRGPRWRVWSSKDLMPDWIGDWTVEIVVADGSVIAAETFTYSAPDA